MTDGPVDTLRSVRGQVRELLDEVTLDSSRVDTMRKSTRWAMQNQKAIATIVDESGSIRNLVVAPRDLSTGGISFLHGGFLHLDVRCIISLRTMKGVTHSIKGRVVRCSHRKGRLHEIGIRFDHEIDPRKFFIDSGDAPLFNTESVNLADYTGVALVMSASESERLLIGGHLESPGITIEGAVDRNEALERLENADPDVMFLDLALGEHDWIDFITSIRDTGYSGAIVALSPRVDSDLRLSAMCAGVTEVIAKPYEPEMLHRAVAEYMGGMSGALHGMRPLICDLKGGALDRSVIASYVDELQNYAADAHEALREEDKDKLKKILLSVEANATQFGFAPIGEACTEALKRLESLDWARAAKGMVYQFIKLCRRAEPPVEGDPFSDDDADAEEQAA